MPYGSVLIIDDVETNIFVASGLMVPYELKIDSAESGFKAIDKVKEGNVYDIIFMDHMMPIMDGIEATKKLRELGYKEPIVALTANAVAGQAEIFLENGFDDFISKPIDIRRLNTVLNTFIRDKQPPDVIEAARAQAQMKSEQTSAAAPKLSFSQQIIESFVRDANKSITALQQIIDMGIPLSKDSMKNYIVHTHGMKSALINVGSMELSADAYKLEQSGRDNDIEFISTETPVFLSALRAFVDNLSSHGKAPADDTPDADISDEKEQSLKETLLSIIDSCGVYDEAAIEKTLTGLKDGTWPQHINEVLNRITELLLHSDFDEIVNVVNGYVHK
jgi:CheY-like chemotaxis protein